MTKAYVLENLEQKVTWGFLAAIILLVMSYLYFINSSVFNIMARREAEEQISTLGTEVALLESEYIGLSSKIDLDLARTLGFREIADEEARYTAKIATPASFSFSGYRASN